jgi:hypothetical protein
MVYYVREFLPELFSGEKDNEALVIELNEFLLDFRKRVDEAMSVGSAEGLTMEEIWKLRAAIFGYESVFIKILGETAIKNYVFKRMIDILSAYLPNTLLEPNISLEDKLQLYVEFISEHDFVKYARVTVKDNEIMIAANRCAFSRIHDSEAYQNLDVRFCPWGMIASAIVAGHKGQETMLESSVFTTQGSVSNIHTK